MITAPLPCDYRTCTRPATWIFRAEGPKGLYSAGTCDRHRDQLTTRAFQRTGATIVDWQPVKNPPPPADDAATALF